MTATGRPLRMISFVGEGVFASVLDSQVVVPLRAIGQAADFEGQAERMVKS